jgi:hypothetical protein
MPLVPEKTSPKADDPATDDRGPFWWDPDPLVLVSRRPRILYFPKVLASRDPTPRDYEAWRSQESTTLRRQEEQLAVGAGVTFLGTYTTSWADLETRPGHATRTPDPAKMLLVEPFSRARDAIASQANKDPATGRLIPAKVNAIYRRILAHLRKEAEDGRAGTVNPWEPMDGFDAPELMLVRLSEMFTQRTDAGQQAHATTFATIRHLRRNPHEAVTPLGALHDYAIRHVSGGARAIVDECRRWATAKKVG